MMLLGLSRLLWKQLNFDSFCKRHLFYCSDDVFTSTVFENSNIAAWNKIALAYLALKTPQIKLDTQAPRDQFVVLAEHIIEHTTTPHIILKKRS